MEKSYFYNWDEVVDVVYGRNGRWYYECDEVDAEIAERKQDFADKLVYYHSQLQDVLAEVRALDRVVADDLEAVMNQIWEAKDEVRK